ncbi:hypothetical protein Esi_0191_0010 [Ectocarpus siliculosus]|uniref:Uncharacterized protein n=1 Tax=Ectocarpus siliculosus TaxID=2880 RepID=D8LHD0_ECTSI|nr:hypothetical protein Esi_0191_0010 [Ectocarpus siliculosus]|eukprot:CBN80247.1 hypothetical protein Esi_0191_0010 [Ectocarpus siliculosus]
MMNTSDSRAIGQRSRSGCGPSIGTRVASAPPSSPALHDASTTQRHQLHRKRGGMGGGAPEDLSSTAAGGTGVSLGRQGGDGGNKSSSSGGGDGPGVTTRTTTTTLPDDPGLQYRSPAVSTNGVLRPTPQEHFVVDGRGGGNSSSSSGATRIRGCRSASSAMAGMTSSSQQGEDGNGGGHRLGSVLLDTPGHSLQQGSGGGGGGVDGGMGLMGNSSGDEKLTTEDQYVMASLKRSIVELSDTCHRLLSFKMLNHDAFVRVMGTGSALPSCRSSGDM